MCEIRRLVNPIGRDEPRNAEWRAEPRWQVTREAGCGARGGSAIERTDRRDGDSVMGRVTIPPTYHGEKFWFFRISSAIWSSGATRSTRRRRAGPTRCRRSLACDAI